MPPPRSRTAHPSYLGDPAVRRYAVLPESDFHRTLDLEQKRTERSHRRFVLMLIESDSLLSIDGDEHSLSPLLDALSRSTRETDVLGWYRERSTIGAIFTEIGPADGRAVAGALLQRFNSALSAVFSIEEINQIRLSFHVFPDDWEQHTNGRPTASIISPKSRPGDDDDKSLQLGMKRLIDIVGSMMALVFLTPLFVLIAAAIKLTSEGPIVFRQQRAGLHGKRFTFLKFRSMYSNNDNSVHKQYVTQLINRDGSRQPASPDGNGKNGNVEDRPVYKITNDPRVTPIGRFLRATSLDELPQFLNVLRGEMSLVGPRPPLPYEVEEYDIWHRRRLAAVKPGITGLWQVTARSRVEFADMVRLDLKYASSWSLWLDLKIIIQTPRAVIAGDGAH